MASKKISKNPASVTFKSGSAEQTKKVGLAIAKQLTPGDVVALFGDLGAGKTTLVKGIAKGLGVKNEAEVASPTFALIHEYSGRVKIYHLDWYRLAEVKNVDAEFAEECFNAGGVTLVEWAGREKKLLPSKRAEIHIKILGPKNRQIDFRRR